MPLTIAPARVDHVLIYACPDCGKETLLRAMDVDGPLACKGCNAEFQPQPLADVAYAAMQEAYIRHQPPVPREVKVIGLRGYCYSMAATANKLTFTTVIDIEQLHGRLSKGEQLPQQEPVLIHGMLREISTPGSFTFAVIEGSNKQAEAFLEFPGATFDVSALRGKSSICVQGHCAGLMGSHNPNSIIFSDCILVGMQGRLLPPGGLCKDALLDLPPKSHRNPSETHLIFQAPPQVEAT